MKKRILKAIEEAYRTGLREGNKNKDIIPYLITSQVEAFKIFQTIVEPSEIKQTNIEIEFTLNYIKSQEAKQRLFNLMSDQYNLTLLDDEMNCIIWALTEGL